MNTRGSSLGWIPADVAPPLPDLDAFEQDLNLNKFYEWVDRPPPSEVENGSTPQSDSDEGGVWQSGHRLPPVLPEFYLADIVFCNIYVLELS